MPYDDDAAEVLVCALITKPLMMPDNLVGHCAGCHRMVQFRPHAPKLIKRQCFDCARAGMLKPDTEILVTDVTVKEVLDHFLQEAQALMNWPSHYILVGHTPVAVDLMTWARWFQTADRKVAETFIGKVRVSTVFLGLDHNFHDEGDPVLFETMIFGGPLNGDMWRYETWADAERGHAFAVERATKASADIKAIADKAGVKS